MPVLLTETIAAISKIQGLPAGARRAAALALAGDLNTVATPEVDPGWLVNAWLALARNAGHRIPREETPAAMRAATLTALAGDPVDWIADARRLGAERRRIAAECHRFAAAAVAAQANITQIAHELGVSPPTVYAWARKNEETG